MTILSHIRTRLHGLGSDILIPTEGNPPVGTFRGHFDVPSRRYQFTAFDATAI